MTVNGARAGRATVAVTGAAGQLGSAIAAAFAADFNVVAFTRATLDVTDHAAVVAAITAADPAIVMNCVAYNDVDGAESAAETAFAVNAMAVRSLARAAAARGALLVHYSTDFVFDGMIDRPYRETDAPSPRSVYAQSKLVGEWMASSAPRHYILRVESLFGGPQARSSVDRIIASVRAGAETRVFHDREVSPSFVDDVVTATRGLIDRDAESGVYHCVNSGHATWLRVAEEIARLCRCEAPLVPVSVKDVPLKAPRPQYAALDNGKLAAAGVAMPQWQDALRRYLSRE